MSLFQISEPGQSPTKEHCAVTTVGIDLGTTNTLVAYVRDGDPTVLCGEDSDPLIPSVVHYGPEGVVVGRGAEARVTDDPVNTIVSAKRFVGRASGDLDSVAQMLPYRFADDSTDQRVVRFEVSGQVVTPIEVSAEILRAAKRRAEVALATSVEAAVITVPAYFDDAQRQATKDAGRLAGLEVMRLLAEPTAAALAYGLDRGSEGTFAVYDLGGGTFDISILKLTSGVFAVKATGGDSALGGDDFDRVIARKMLDECAGDDGGPEVIARALRKAREVKEALTLSETAEFTLSLADGSSFRRALSRAELAEWVRPLLERTGRASRRALKDAEIRTRDLDGVILVGGATRSPVVREYVQEIYGREPLCDLDPDQVVALGAASQAHMLSGGASDVVLLDVVPLSLGIETMGGVVEKLILRNSTIPARAKQTFTTYADDQTGFVLHVLQGERETVEGNRSLATFYLKGIPPMVAGMARIEIVFAIDADGLLRVQARELTTGIETSVDVKPTYGLTDEEVETMLLDSFANAEQDLAERNVRIQRVEAERILAATRTAMEDDAELLDDETRRATEVAMAVLEGAVKNTDHVAIRKAVEGLDLASKPFAERRMNRAVRGAISGRTVSDVEGEIAG